MYVSKRLLEEIKDAIGVHWSDSEEDSDEDEDKERPSDDGASTQANKEVAEQSRRRCEALEQLLAQQPRDTICYHTLRRALYKVCELGLQDVAEFLLRFGADPKYYVDKKKDYTPLEVAITNGHSEVLKILVKYGADINEDCDMPPLILACVKKQWSCVRTLLDLGADVDARDDEGRTALVLAFDESEGEDGIDGLQLLLQRGADPNVECDYECMKAMESRLYSVLIGGAFKDDETLKKVCEYCVKVLRLLLIHGFSPMCCDDDDDEEEISLQCLSLSYFDSLFPVAALLLDSGVPFVPDHPCWSRYEVLFDSLCISLYQCSEAEAEDFVNKAQALVDLAKVNFPSRRLTSSLEPPDSLVDSNPRARTLRDFHQRVAAGDNSPAPLQSLCRGVIRRRLMPWPLEQKVQELPLPALLKDFLLPLKK